ncbi:hypothetical protein HBI65_216390 [Parastagonospora nodorum]|nr:hypothetical protein HBI65_216390 [Parastagonospora nodorum]
MALLFWANCHHNLISIDYRRRATRQHHGYPILHISQLTIAKTPCSTRYLLRNRSRGITLRTRSTSNKPQRHGEGRGGRLGTSLPRVRRGYSVPAAMDEYEPARQLYRVALPTYLETR